MNTKQLLELAERCEREEWSRKLDGAIFKAIGLTASQESHCAWWCQQNGRTDLTRERYISAWAPSYTTSLDAAVTLVPEGFDWLVETLCGPVAQVIGPENDAGNVPRGVSDVEGVKSAALALCAAALKARAALAEQTEASTKRGEANTPKEGT